MAKRGRPPKPKIETVKKRVGRPPAKIRHDIIQLWILATTIKCSRKVKLKAISDQRHISEKTVERIITAFEKDIKKRNLIVYACPISAIVIMIENPRWNALILPKPHIEFINIDDF